MTCWLAAVGGLAAGCTEASPPDVEPNFVMILIDDLGWNDVGAYGNQTVQTPHIDSLAAQGARFDAALLTTSSCSPSRASLMTGRYPHSTGAQELHSPLPANQILFPTLLREAGYFTGAAGKWHLGDAAARQFDRHYPHTERTGAADWIRVLRERPRGRPFFLWLASRDPHRPWKELKRRRHAPQDIDVPPYLADTPATRNELARYYDSISGIDDRVGDVLAELERQGVANDTVVIVSSDNGRPFPRAKATLFDSGVRTPFIVRWPGRVAPGAVREHLISAVDLAPTLLELAGVALPSSMQGISFARALRAPDIETREYAFLERNWHGTYAYERGVRSRNHLYLRNVYPRVGECTTAPLSQSAASQDLVALLRSNGLTPEQAQCFTTHRPIEALYDVNRDPYSFVNLAADPRHTAELERMRGALDRWVDETEDRLAVERCDQPKQIPCKALLKLQRAGRVDTRGRMMRPTGRPGEAVFSRPPRGAAGSSLRGN